MKNIQDEKLQDLAENETTIVSSDDKIFIPEDAHSKFRFDIKENIEDLMKDMKERPKKHTPQTREVDEDTGEVRFSGGDSVSPWNFVKTNWERNEWGDFWLEDPDFDCWARVWQEKDKLAIVTAFGDYKYDIQQKKRRRMCC